MTPLITFLLSSSILGAVLTSSSAQTNMDQAQPTCENQAPTCTCQRERESMASCEFNNQTLDTNFNLPTDVTELRIRNSELDTIQPFPRLEHLTDLFFTDSGIRFLGDSVFGQLPQLKKLVLANNTITALGPNTFKGVEGVTLIDLQNNSLFELVSDVFVGSSLPNLQELDLRSCQLYKISRTAFGALDKLLVVNIANNALQHVPHFPGSTSLQFLDLSNNEISELKHGDFQVLIGLTKLTLSHNNIEQLTNNIFTGMKSLTDLNLSDNDLMHIGHTVFTNTPSLAILDMSRNKLQTLISNQALYENVTKVSLHDNPWVCNCSILWMQTQSVIMESNPNLRCTLPRAGENLLNADVHECHDSQHGLHANTVAVGMAVFIACILIGFAVFVTLRRTVRGKRRYHGQMDPSSPYNHVLVEGEEPMGVI